MGGWYGAKSGDGDEVDGAGAQAPRRLADSLDRVIAGLGGPGRDRAKTANGSSGLFSRWAEVVGPDIAARTRLLGVQQGELIVAVDDPAWASQLRWLATDLLARIASAGGPQLDGLQVRVKPR